MGDGRKEERGSDWNWRDWAGFEWTRGHLLPGRRPRGGLLREPAVVLPLQFCTSGSHLNRLGLFPLLEAGTSNRNDLIGALGNFDERICGTLLRQACDIRRMVSIKHRSQERRVGLRVMTQVPRGRVSWSNENAERPNFYGH